MHPIDACTVTPLAQGSNTNTVVSPKVRFVEDFLNVEADMISAITSTCYFQFKYVTTSIGAAFWSVCA
jgi:hypothetical protein